MRWLSIVPKIRSCFGFGIGSVSRYTCIASSLIQPAAVQRRCFVVKIVGSQAIRRLRHTRDSL